ncbi:hypothetical protein [Nonomuraea salmonea]|uniref:hypothetical protein n=1 Tax=Nonomuraea salmonea TaxID=46181 RepID=UPI002FEB00AB
MPAGLNRALLTVAGAAIAVVLAIAICSVAIVVAGGSPLDALVAFFDFGNSARAESNSVATFLNRAVPLFIAGLAVAVGFRMNLFNIGVEGQYRIAAICAAFVGSTFTAPAPHPDRGHHPRGGRRRRPVRAHPRRHEGDQGRERGHLHDHAQLHRDRAVGVPAARAVRG